MVNSPLRRDPGFFDRGSSCTGSQVESIVEGQPEGAITFASVSWEINQRRFGSLDVPGFPDPKINTSPKKETIISIVNYIFQPLIFRGYVTWMSRDGSERIPMVIGSVG